jgi:DNA gyrase subunit A
MIPSGTFKVIVTEKNYIRKIPDVDRVTVVRGDQPKFITRADNTENVLLFDNKGRVFKMPVHKIPICDKTSAGQDIRILNKNLTADVINMCYEPTIKHIYENGRKHYVVMCTRNNVIKKIELEDFLNVNNSGLRYTNLKDSDEVVGIEICPDDLDIVIYSKTKALRVPLSNIPLFKRNAAGSKAMNTDSEIEGISIIYPDTDCIVVLTDHGKANKFPIAGLPQHSRAKAGNNVIKLDQGDSIHSIYGTREVDKLRILTNDGITEVPVSEIKLKSGIAAGQKIVSGKPVIKCDLIYQQ